MKVIILGAGQLGSRHAQSIATVLPKTSLWLVDTSAEALITANELVQSTGFSGQIELLATIPNEPTNFDLAILATSSTPRAGLLEELLQTHKPKVVLLEKLLASNIEDLNLIASLIYKSDAKFFVNCPMPYFNHYAKMSEYVKREGTKIEYRVRASNLGLVTNAIHYLDHYLHLGGDSRLGLKFEETTRLIQSKRMGYSEALGRIYGESTSGDVFDIEFEERPEQSLVVSISTGDHTWHFDELLGLEEHHIKGSLHAKSMFQTPRQSELTGKSLLRLELGQDPLWAPIDRGFIGHRLLLNAISEIPQVKQNQAIVFT